MTDVDEFLEHHGVKGMHWGVRRRDKVSTRSSSDYKTVAAIRNKKPHQLTNKQLKKHNERLNLEMKFREANPTKIAKGKKHVDALLVATTGAVGVAAVRKLATEKNLAKMVSLGKKFVASTPKAKIRAATLANLNRGLG